MEELEKLKRWIVGFPRWGEAALTVDDTGAAPGSCGLFPLGVEQLRVREDVLGGKTLRLRQKFLLRRRAIRGEDAAGWLLELQNWAAAGDAPVFGADQRVRWEKGKLSGGSQTGTGLYEVYIIFEYTKGE